MYASLESQENIGNNYLSLNKYMTLPQAKRVQVEYVWIGGHGELRAKTRSLQGPIKTVDAIPDWNYDGSSTDQATGDDSEVFLKPVKIVPDPFRPTGDNLLCLCESIEAKTMKPLKTNHRDAAAKVFGNKKVKHEEPWYGIEQEYTLFNAVTSTPLGFPLKGYPEAQGPYYCGVGCKAAYGRHIAEAHYRACLFAGLDISGINAEVMPGQWEFQIGPSVGIDAADQLWIARYMLQRIAEDFGVNVSYEPKPLKGDWNGAGAHTNYSTRSMRKDGGYKVIIEAIKRLGKMHDEHMAVYGEGNKDRLTGHHETASWKVFKYGVADRGASIRIPRQTAAEKKGYLEDRRPASNCDPYLVTSMIARTTILDDWPEKKSNNDAPKIKRKKSKKSKANDLDLSIYEKGDAIEPVQRLAVALKYYSLLTMSNKKHQDIFVEFMKDVYDKFLQDLKILVKYKAQKMKQVHQVLANSSSFGALAKTSFAKDRNDKIQSVADFYIQSMVSVHELVFCVMAKSNNKADKDKEIKRINGLIKKGGKLIKGY